MSDISSIINSVGSIMPGDAVSNVTGHSTGRNVNNHGITIGNHSLYAGSGVTATTSFQNGFGHMTLNSFQEGDHSDVASDVSYASNSSTRAVVGTGTSAEPTAARWAQALEMIEQGQHDMSTVRVDDALDKWCAGEEIKSQQDEANLIQTLNEGHGPNANPNQLEEEDINMEPEGSNGIEPQDMEAVRLATEERAAEMQHTQAEMMEVEEESEANREHNSIVAARLTSPISSVNQTSSAGPSVAAGTSDQESNTRKRARDTTEDNEEPAPQRARVTVETNQEPAPQRAPITLDNNSGPIARHARRLVLQRATNARDLNRSRQTRREFRTTATVLQHIERKVHLYKQHMEGRIAAARSQSTNHNTLQNRNDYQALRNSFHFSEVCKAIARAWRNFRRQE